MQATGRQSSNILNMIKWYGRHGCNDSYHKNTRVCLPATWLRCYCRCRRQRINKCTQLVSLGENITDVNVYAYVSVVWISLRSICLSQPECVAILENIWHDTEHILQHLCGPLDANGVAVVLVATAIETNKSNDATTATATALALPPPNRALY